MRKMSLSLMGIEKSLLRFNAGKEFCVQAVGGEKIHLPAQALLQGEVEAGQDKQAAYLTLVDPKVYIAVVRGISAGKGAKEKYPFDAKLFSQICHSSLYVGDLRGLSLRSSSFPVLQVIISYRGAKLNTFLLGCTLRPRQALNSVSQKHNYKG